MRTLKIRILAISLLILLLLVLLVVLWRIIPDAVTALKEIGCVLKPADTFVCLGGATTSPQRHQRPYDSCLQKYTVSFQTSRVAASVHPFMRLLDNPDNGPKKLDFLQSIITGLRAAFHQREFDIRQITLGHDPVV